MVSVLLSKIVILVAGTLYPAYRSYKAVRNKNVREYVKWMMYWIVFALFTFMETLADIFVAFWMPFYYELKIVFVFWLLSPWTKGASILYRKWIHPTLSKHEREIDHMLEQAKSESYNQVLRLGSRGLLCARDVIATAALRGQTQLVEQIQRSYSTNDVNRRIEPPSINRVVEVQEEEDEENEIWDEELSEGESEPEHPDQAGDDAKKQSKTQKLPPVRASRRKKSPANDLPEAKYNTLPRRSARLHK